MKRRNQGTHKIKTQKQTDKVPGDTLVLWYVSSYVMKMRECVNISVLEYAHVICCTSHSQCSKYRCVVQIFKQPAITFLGKDSHISCSTAKYICYILCTQITE